MENEITENEGKQNEQSLGNIVTPTPKGVNATNESTSEQHYSNQKHGDESGRRVFNKEWWNDKSNVIMGTANIVMALFTLIAIIVATKSFKVSQKAAR